MTIAMLENCRESFLGKGVLAGLDVGKKTIGIAISSPEQSFAIPLQTLKRVKFSKDVQSLLNLLKEHDVQGVIIGLPLNDDGSENRTSQSIKDFALEFRRTLNEEGQNQIPLAFQNEFLSTKTVENLVDNFVDKRKTKIESKSSGLIDKLAAQTILQRALDQLNMITL